MDLYSSDVGAIQEGNMRSQSVMDANNRIREHNNDLAGQISQLKSQQKSADTEEGIKDAIGGFISGGKIGGKIKALNDWNANRNAGESSTAPPTEEDPSTTLKDEGDGVFSSDAPLEGETEGVMSRAKSGVKSALGISDEAAETIGKGAGEIASVGLAGMDIYKDIKAGGIAGDNWASKTSNVLQIGGAIADIGGTVFPPLALLGGVMDIASGVTGEVGDVVDSGKQDDADDKLQQQETEKPLAIETTGATTTGRVS